MMSTKKSNPKKVAKSGKKVAKMKTPKKAAKAAAKITPKPAAKAATKKVSKAPSKAKPLAEPKKPKEKKPSIAMAIRDLIERKGVDNVTTEEAVSLAKKIKPDSRFSSRHLAWYKSKARAERRP